MVIIVGLDIGISFICDTSVLMALQFYFAYTFMLYFKLNESLPKQWKKSAFISLILKQVMLGNEHKMHILEFYTPIMG